MNTLILFNQSRAPLPPFQIFRLPWGTSAWTRWFLAFLEHALPPWDTTTHPCAHPNLSYLHTCSNMPQPRSHKDSWLFGMIWRLIGPPRGVLGSNIRLALVCIHMESKASQCFPIILYINSRHSYIMYSHNNICYWLHVCMQFLVF